MVNIPQAQVLLTYTGKFLNGMFNDNSTEGGASYELGNDLKYKGNFYQGKRDGVGSLLLWNIEINGYYTAYYGLWKEDKPTNGIAYTPEGD
jgi:hypothetical protein